MGVHEGADGEVPGPGWGRAEMKEEALRDFQSLYFSHRFERLRCLEMGLRYVVVVHDGHEELLEPLGLSERVNRLLFELHNHVVKFVVTRFAKLVEKPEGEGGEEETGEPALPVRLT